MIMNEIQCPYCSYSMDYRDNIYDTLDFGGDPLNGVVKEFIGYDCPRCGRSFGATIQFETKFEKVVNVI